MTDTPKLNEDADGGCPPATCSAVARNVTWKDLLISNLKSEQLHDAEREYALASITMTFGKYVGKSLSEIPLRYLDETVSVMPKTWLVRRVHEFVDLVMDNYHVEGFWVAKVPHLSSEEIEQIRDSDSNRTEI